MMKAAVTEFLQADLAPKDSKQVSDLVNIIINLLIISWFSVRGNYNSGTQIHLQLGIGAMTWSDNAKPLLFCASTYLPST